MSWWEGSDRLSRELVRLRERGFLTAFDEKTNINPTIVIDTTYVVGGKNYNLRIVFPDLYPYFRPEVFATDLALPHHQNPFDKNLCLLGRNSDNWNTNDLIADVIADQLPKLLASETTAAAGGQPEEELQAEPWSEYLLPVEDIRIMWNAAVAIPPGAPGTVEITYHPQDGLFAGYVSRVMRGQSELFVEAKSPMPDASSKYLVPFIALTGDPPPKTEIEALFKASLPKYQPQGYVRKMGGSRGTLVALFFPEENEHRKTGSGLTFVRLKQAGKDGKMPIDYVRTYRTGPDYCISRFGPYGSVANLKIVLVGFGNLGSAVAVNLCKLGVNKLTLVDRDIFEAGNTARHYLGMEHVGRDKVTAGAEVLARSYPYTEVKPLPFRLNDLDSPAKVAQLFAAIDESNVIIDCSAERGVQHLLSTEAWYREKTFVFAEGYPGMLGGFAGIIEPGVGPCYHCFLQGLTDRSVAMPPSLPNGTVQPPGCAEPTFVGTPFDSDTVAAAAVRLLFSHHATGTGYPKTKSPYYRIEIADDAKQGWSVNIEPVSVGKRPGCAYCQAK